MKPPVAISIALFAIIVVACSSDQEPSAAVQDSADSGQPTPAAPAASVDIASSDATECVPGLPIEEQKKRLVAIASRQFSGPTVHDAEMARLHYDPEARDRRQGGIWVVVEFNGDELDTVAEKKAALDVKMQDAYEALYVAGCEDLAQVDLTARAMAVAVGGIEGGVVQTLAAVYKTRLTREVADTVDWSSKDTLDFNEIWDTLLLNVRWKKELEGD
jgi:hypothetical protein